MSEINSYTADNIKHLELFPDALRGKPSVFLDAIGLNAVLKLFNEQFANAIDEFNAIGGTCTDIGVDIVVENGIPTFTVTDNGRGIPHEKLVQILTELYTSGKYDNDSYETSIGTNGIGTKLLVAMSTEFECITWRDHQKQTFTSQHGVNIKTNIEKYAGNDTGSIFKVTPDKDVLLEIDITNQKERYSNFVEILSYINAGVKIHMSWNGKKTTFYNPGGLPDYFESIRSKKKLKILGKEPINIKHRDPITGMAMHVVFGFASNQSREYSLSYINGHHTKDGGVHMAGLRRSLGVFTKEINKGGYVPKSASYKVVGDDVRDLLVAVVTSNHKKPIYGNQTKSTFESLDYGDYITTVLAEEIPKWISTHPEQFDEIAKMIAKVARAKYEAKKAKGEVMKTTSVKSNMMATVDPRKFTDCNSTDHTKNELFIVEGNSAGGSAASARDKDHQAVYRLRGKMKNMLKKSGLSEEFQNLVKIQNCGYGPTKDVSKLRYDKIIFACDADVDGEHIASILSGFYFLEFRELIETGHVYMAKPPLYLIKLKGEKLYLHTMDQYTKFIILNGMKTYDLLDKNGNTMPEDMKPFYMRAVLECGELIKESSIQMGVDPILMELIVKNFKSIMKDDGDKFLRPYGYHISEFIKNGDDYSIAIEHGYNHYHVSINREIFKNYIKPIHDHLVNHVHLTDMHMRGIKSNQLYSNLTYGHYSLLIGSIEDGNVKIQRFKGLGEMNPDQLKETTMDPETRFLVRLTMDDYDRAEKWMNLLLNTNSQEKKDLFTF